MSARIGTGGWVQLIQKAMEHTFAAAQTVKKGALLLRHGGIRGLEYLDANAVLGEKYEGNEE